MCDCYCPKCLFCDNKVSIHIADFCTPRENVDIICPDCQTYENLCTGENKGLNIAKYKKLFIDYIFCRMQIVEGKLKDGRYKGKPVIFLCKDSNAYGISLN